MKVVILCGGLGMRLKEETEFRPKPMVQIGDRPIIWHIMKHYSYYGFKEFVLCLGYRADVIKDFFRNFHFLTSDFTVDLCYPPRYELHQTSEESEWRVTLVDTGKEAQTGARLKRVEKYISDENFLLTYGDGVSNLDLHGLIEFHKSQGRLATVTGVNPPARFGELEVEGGRALHFREKPQTQVGLISGGFFVLNKRVFDYLQDDDACNFEKGPLAELADDGQLSVFSHHGFWQCMDTYRDFVLLNELWAQSAAPWRIW